MPFLGLVRNALASLKAATNLTWDTRIIPDYVRRSCSACKPHLEGGIEREDRSHKDWFLEIRLHTFSKGELLQGGQRSSFEAIVCLIFVSIQPTTGKG